jgi:hypothetical protein
MNPKISDRLSSGFLKFVNHAFIEKFNDLVSYPKILDFKFKIEPKGPKNMIIYYWTVEVNEKDFNEVSNSSKPASAYWDTDLGDFDFVYVSFVMFAEFEILFNFRSSYEPIPKQVFMTLKNGDREFTYDADT